MGIAILLKTSLIEDDASPKYILLNKDATRIGRSSEIRMDTAKGKEISKHHSTIYRREQCGEEVWILEDNNSLNGTFLNKRKIHRVYLNDGDEVVFGGGPNFCQGDTLASTDSAPCRYSFFIPFQPIKFLSSSNPNQSICPTEQCEECPICLGPMTAPETLPCHHTFCLHCLRLWAKTCISQYRTCVCPLCRAPFHASSLTPEEAIISKDLIEITSTEPFLRDVNYTSCKKIRSFNIFKKWTQAQKDAFWKTYNAIRKNRLRCAIFLHLTKATINYIFSAPRVDLQQAVINLTGQEKPIDRNELILTLLLFIHKKLMPPTPPHIPTPRPKKMYYY